MHCNIDTLALQGFNFKRVQLTKEYFPLELFSVLVCLLLIPTGHLQHENKICQNPFALERGRWQAQISIIPVGC